MWISPRYTVTVIIINLILISNFIKLHTAQFLDAGGNCFIFLWSCQSLIRREILLFWFFHVILTWHIFRLFIFLLVITYFWYFFPLFILFPVFYALLRLLFASAHFKQNRNVQVIGITNPYRRWKLQKGMRVVGQEKEKVGWADWRKVKMGEDY